MVFIDLVKAFESIDIGALAKALDDYDISNPIKRFIWDINKGQ